MFKMEVRDSHKILQLDSELFDHIGPVVLGDSHLVGDSNIFKIHFFIKAGCIQTVGSNVGI